MTDNNIRHQPRMPPIAIGFEKQVAEINLNFEEQKRLHKGQTALLAQLEKERIQKIADLKKQDTDEKKKQEIIDQKQLFDLEQDERIKNAKSEDEAIKLKIEKLQKDEEFDLKTQTRNDTQKLIDKEKYQLQMQALFDSFHQKNTKTQDDSDKKQKAVHKKTADDEIKIIDEKARKYAGYYSKMASMFAKNTEVSKAAFLAQKAIAAAEIAINTEKQVSAIFTATRNAVSGDMSLGPIAGPIKAVIDIALGAVEIGAAIADGVKQVNTVNSTNPQGFAHGGLYLSDGYGGYLSGNGSGTSDSINARLSNDESIINARSTEMFAPILSAINQAGGGRAFNSQNPGNGYALGGMFNGSNTFNDGSTDLANARAVNNMVKTFAANMPRQVLVVEDVQASLQNKVMLQNMSNF